VTLSFVFRTLNTGGPSQAKGGIWVLKSLTGVGNMSSAKSIGTWYRMDCNHHGHPQWRGLLPILGSEIMV